MSHDACQQEPPTKTVKNGRYANIKIHIVNIQMITLVLWYFQTTWHVQIIILSEENVYLPSSRSLLLGWPIHQIWRNRSRGSEISSEI